VLADESGSVLFTAAASCTTNGLGHVALLHDHDLDLFTDHASLADDGQSGSFAWRANAALPIASIRRADVPVRFGFVASPAQEAART
jgi:hypothetical protein